MTCLAESLNGIKARGWGIEGNRLEVQILLLAQEPTIERSVGTTD